MPEGHNADALRKMALDRFDVSLGTGLSKVAGKVFRIGHLGDTNDLTLIATLAGCEMALALAGVPHQKGGMAAAMGDFDGSGEGAESGAAALRDMGPDVFRTAAEHQSPTLLGKPGLDVIPIYPSTDESTSGLPVIQEYPADQDRFIQVSLNRSA